MGHKILITGGAGFIGTHLCRALVNAGHDVRVLDIVGPRTRVDGVHYLRGDVRDSAALTEAIHGVASVYHFAALVSVPLCQENPFDSYRTNVLATCQVGEAILLESKRQGLPVRLLYSGSAAVYGNAGKENQPLNESEPLQHPLSFYGAQKLASEHIIRLFHQTAGLPAIVFRFFNVFGEGQDPNSPYSGVISIFNSSIKNGAPLQLNGGGSQTRDFVSVHDVVNACVLGLSLPRDKCDGKPVNLGSGRATSIRVLAREMIRVSAHKIISQVTDSPPREGDVLHSLADISCAKEIFGWKPQVTLNQGLAELL